MNAFYYSTHPTSAASPSPRGLVRGSQCMEGLPWVSFPSVLLPSNVLLAEGTLGSAPSTPGCGARSLLHQPPPPFPEPLLFGYNVVLCMEAEANALRRACSAATEVDDGEGAPKGEEELMYLESEEEVEAEVESAMEEANTSREILQESSESGRLSVTLAPTLFGMTVFQRAQEIQKNRVGQGGEVVPAKYLGQNPPLQALPSGLFTPTDGSIRGSSLNSPLSTSHPLSPPQYGGSTGGGDGGGGGGGGGCRDVAATRRGGGSVRHMEESSSSSSSFSRREASYHTPASLGLFKHLAHLPHGSDTTYCPSEASPTQPVGAMESVEHTDSSAAPPHNIFEEEEEEEEEKEEEGKKLEEGKPTSAGAAPGGDDESTAEQVQMAGQGAPTDSSLTQVDEVGGMFTTGGESEGGVGVLGDGSAQPHSLGGMAGIAAAATAVAAVAPGAKDIDTSLTQIDEEVVVAIQTATEGILQGIKEEEEEEEEKVGGEEGADFADDEGDMAPTLANGEVDVNTTVVSCGPEEPPLLPPSAMDMDLSSSSDSGGEACTLPPPLPFPPPFPAHPPSSEAPAVGEKEDEENSSPPLSLSSHRWEMQLVVDGESDAGSSSSSSSSSSSEDEGMAAAAGTTLIRTYRGGGGGVKRPRDEAVGGGVKQRSPTLAMLLSQPKAGQNRSMEEGIEAAREEDGADAREGGQGEAAATHVGAQQPVQSKAETRQGKRVRFSEGTKCLDGGVLQVAIDDKARGSGSGSGSGSSSSSSSESGSGSSGSESREGGGGGGGGGTVTQTVVLTTYGQGPQRVSQRVTSNLSLGTRITGSGGIGSGGSGSGIGGGGGSSSSATPRSNKDQCPPTSSAALSNHRPTTRGAQALAAAMKNS